MPTLPMNPFERTVPVGHLPMRTAAGAEHRPMTAQTQREQFLILLGAYRPSGGLTRGDDLADLLARRCGLPIGVLARWMVEGKVLHFEWQRDTWFPMFQFNDRNLALRTGIDQILDEFSGVLDAWELAQWFASPQAELGWQTPADEMAHHPERVLQAARSSRYVVDA